MNDMHMLLLMADGSVQAFGDNRDGKTLVPQSQIRNQAVKVAAGVGHSLVLLRDGTVVGFGSNDAGKTGPMPSEALPGGVGVADIAAGPDYSLFLLKNGSVIGIGYMPFEPLRSLSAATQRDIRSISCMWRLCGAIKVSGEVILWGFNNSMFSEDTAIWPIPPEVQTAGVATLSVGYSHVAAMLRNGQGAVWGLNDYGQAEFPDGVAPTDVKSIAAGGWHTVVLLASGQLEAFGRSDESQIDVPDSASSPSTMGVAAGTKSSCALLLSPPELPPTRMSQFVC
jgi:alpha-tubulin suppressor-like RCC1 family protein